MDFGLSQDQRQILDTVDRLMARHLPAEAVRRHDRDHETPDHLMAAYAEAGLLALPFPALFGGLAQPWQTVALVQERLGYHAAIAAALFSTTVGFGGMTLLAGGSPAQRERLLPALIAGRLRFALALTEPGAGSDAGALVTAARKAPEGWRLSGRKTWISLADRADYLVTACRTEPGSTGARGVTLFLVPRGAPGMAMTPLEKIGNNCLGSWDIGFDEVPVPEDAVLGAVGGGFRLLMATLQFGRAGQAANAIGQAQRAIDITLAHARERVQFGRPIGAFQVIRHRLADMQTRVEQARLMLYRLAWMIDQGQDCRMAAAQAKLVASETLQWVADQGMQTLASAGYAAESDMQRIWRDARLYSFGEGASELQRDIIARAMGLEGGA